MNCSSIISNVSEIENKWKYYIKAYNEKNNTNYHFRLIRNKARGNCLFIALEQAFPEYNRNSLRKQAIHYILNNSNMMQQLLDQNTNDYNKDLLDNTTLLNGNGWPLGGPNTIKENLIDKNPSTNRKAIIQLKKILSKASYYADNEMIEAIEQVLDMGIILLSDISGEIAWHPISTKYKNYIIIYNYDDLHYELVELADLNKNTDYQRVWSSWDEIPQIIKDLFPSSLLVQRDLKSIYGFNNEDDDDDDDDDDDESDNINNLDKLDINEYDNFKI